VDLQQFVFGDAAGAMQRLHALADQEQRVADDRAAERDSSTIRAAAVLCRRSVERMGRISMMFSEGAVRTAT
jgi:hypothetical protein